NDVLRVVGSLMPVDQYRLGVRQELLPVAPSSTFHVIARPQPTDTHFHIVLLRQPVGFVLLEADPERLLGGHADVDKSTGTKDYMVAVDLVRTIVIVPTEFEDHIQPDRILPLHSHPSHASPALRICPTKRR